MGNVVRVRVRESYSIELPEPVVRALNLRVGDELLLEIRERSVIMRRAFDVEKWRREVSRLVGVWRSHPLLKQFGSAVRAVRWLRGHEDIRGDQRDRQPARR